MKRFRFPLERVLEWRRLEANLEAATLASLLGEKHRLQQAAEELEAQVLDATIAIQGRASLDACDLASLDAFRKWAKRRREEFQVQKAKLLVRTEDQRCRLLAARRKVQVLERLKERMRHEWSREYDRETEQLAAESYLARRPKMPAGLPRRQAL